MAVRVTCALLSWALLSLLWGCATPQLHTPNGYVALDDEELSINAATYKAVSSDGAVLMVRLQEEQPEGTPEFWAEALQREFTEGLGYTLVEAGDVRTKEGVSGRVLRLKGSLEDQIYHYDVAVFVFDKEDVVTVEASAPEALYSEHVERFNEAMTTLHFD